MNDSNRKIQETLHDFEVLPNIEPSDAWQQSVMDKLAATQPDAVVSFRAKILTLVAVLFICLNIGFILKETLETTSETTLVNVQNTPMDAQREMNFKTISKELFSN